MSKEEDIFRQKVYKYQIEGLNDQQIESYNPELAIRSLPPGSYKIMASCTAKDGSWIPNQEVLELTILPPWYRTWWFILSCAVFVVAVIIETFRRTLKRKEEKLKWAMKEHEQQVYEEKVRFLINISHELRTPLTLIHAPLSRILKSLSSEDHQYLPLKAIYRQSQRMKNLINMVLDVRKMEVGESKMQIQPHPLNKWIEDVSQDFISEGEAKNVRIRYELDPRIETVSFDKDKCETILSNLLINALKHSPENTEITITSELLSEESRIRISIIDQGNGLQQVDTRKLFTRFYQGTGEQSGTGIGLSYSKILVELHGGSIGAFNLIPQIGGEQFEGYTSEEMKMQNEGRKIMHLPELKVSCTCVRVPVVRSHSVSIVVRTREKISVERARQLIAAAPGCRLVDDLANKRYPMPLETSDQDLVFVGRIRDDLTSDNGLNIWCCGDQVRKGAATNAVQIAQLLVQE